MIGPDSSEVYRNLAEQALARDESQNEVQDQVTYRSDDLFRLGQSEATVYSELQSTELSKTGPLPSPDPSISQGLDQATPARDQGLGHDYFERSETPVATPSAIPRAFPEVTSTTPPYTPAQTSPPPENATATSGDAMVISRDAIVTPERTSLTQEGVDFLRDRPIPRQTDIRVDPVPFPIRQQRYSTGVDRVDVDRADVDPAHIIEGKRKRVQKRDPSY
ncbi:uncharacterized protein N7483_003320 [Penicillium malachiteum]|uniref:uncharacterized protein n=1 Tax=Penicillium malachiteum TaxID=1324776 RepID=UPI002546F2B3|nr:uncharacterized protein N7483_003320 [Penicillium malachiteum]KAJ5728812.1 hypothetical protein N7483_003320 [Penicillium malachiteum]